MTTDTERFVVSHHSLRRFWHRRCTRIAPSRSSSPNTSPCHVTTCVRQFNLGSNGDSSFSHTGGNLALSLLAASQYHHS